MSNTPMRALLEILVGFGVLAAATALLLLWLLLDSVY